MILDPLSFLNLFQLSLLVKLFLLVLAFFYLVFSLVVYRQISLMTQVLDSRISPVVRLTALLQIIAVAVLFLLVWLLL